MNIKKIKIKNYRSIKTEIIVNFNGELIIIGPNNSGKTNFLKAINLFFHGLKENQYTIANDLPFGLTGEQTSIVISFDTTSNKDGDFLSKYRQITDLLDENKEIEDESINLYLSFSSTGRPNYRFFTNDKIKSDKRDEYRRLHEELIIDFLNHFVCHYIPSEKNSGELFKELLLPHLKRNIGNILQKHQHTVDEALFVVSESISKNMKQAGLSEMSCMFGLPDNLFSSALSKFDFFIDDGEKTSFHQKGSGVQAATILACLEWITEREKLDGKDVIWLIEEPESYLHPGLAEACRNILESLSRSSDLFTTTHSMGFIPKNNEKVLQSSISERNETSLKILKGYSEATQSIRNSLGIRFSDYYNLTEYNIFVEGKTDKILLQHVLNIVKPKGKTNTFQALRHASIMDFSGVSSLKDFLKSTYSFMAKERSIVAIFDGDDAGIRATGELGHYFSNKDVQFNPNQDYIILPNRRPIEALFPIECLQELAQAHPKWMRIEQDVFGHVVSIHMPGDCKTNISKWLIDRSTKATTSANGTYIWAKEFIAVFTVLNQILIDKNTKLSHTK